MALYRGLLVSLSQTIVVALIGDANCYFSPGNPILAIASAAQLI
jgi:hypothetical protein